MHSLFLLRLNEARCVYLYSACSLHPLSAFLPPFQSFPGEIDGIDRVKLHYALFFSMYHPQFLTLTKPHYFIFYLQYVFVLFIITRRYYIVSSLTLTYLRDISLTSTDSLEIGVFCDFFFENVSNAHIHCCYQYIGALI